MSQKPPALVALQPDHTGWTMPVLADQLNAQPNHGTVGVRQSRVPPR